MNEAMMRELAAKFNEPTYAHKLQILTLSPYTIELTKEKFGTTNHMVTRARQIKKYCGIMGMPDKKKGKRLREDVKMKIQDFYLQDDNSRLCPGEKDYKSVSSKDGKTHHQKRLLLGNLKELYESWKQENINCKVGFSTFAALWPQ